MGRAMLIISAGAVIALGMLQVGIQNQRAAIAERTAVSAYEVEVRNKAFTASQLAMERINETEGSWHPTESNPWIEVIDGDSISLHYEIDSTSTPSMGSLAYLDDDTVNIYSSSWYWDTRSNRKEELTINASYIKSALHFVPEFKSGMSFATDDFNISASGSSLISGNSMSGECEDRPAITTVSESKANDVDYNVDSSHMDSDSVDVSYDSTLSYKPVDDLIARLSESAQYISGNYKGEMGSEDDPGVFFVEENAKLSGGISEGYGIMVVRSGGELAYDSAGVELDIAGNFTFNGLVIFEDAYNLDGSGTPTINGSVLVGKKDEDSGNVLDVDLNGNLTIQYDCTAEKYAQVASAKELKQNRYTRLSTFE